MKRSSIAIASCAVVLAAGAAAALHLPGQASELGEDMRGGATALAAFGGVATIVHADADGNVIGEQSVHNRLLDAGEDYILRQVFMDGSSDPDASQIGAICLSAAEPGSLPGSQSGAIPETLDRATFNSTHAAAVASASVTSASTITEGQTRECLTDTTVSSSGQIATVGPLTFTANNTAGSSNWKPEVPIKMIGICQGFGGANAAECTAPLFAAVDINEVTLANDETLTVTYTFDMRSPIN